MAGQLRSLARQWVTGFAEADAGPSTVLIDELNAGGLQGRAHREDRIVRHQSSCSFKVHNGRKSKTRRTSQLRLRQIKDSPSGPALSRAHVSNTKC